MESSKRGPPKLRLLSDSSIDTLSGPETRGLGFLRSVLSEAEKCELSAPGVVRIPNYHEGVNVLLMVERTIVMNRHSKTAFLVLEAHCYDYCTAIIVPSEINRHLPITDYIASFILLAESDFGDSCDYAPCLETLDMAVRHSIVGDVRVERSEEVWISPSRRWTLGRGRRRIFSPWEWRCGRLHIR